MTTELNSIRGILDKIALGNGRYGVIMQVDAQITRPVRCIFRKELELDEIDKMVGMYCKLYGVLKYEGNTLIEIKVGDPTNMDSGSCLGDSLIRDE